MVSERGKRILLSLAGERFLKCYYRFFFVLFSAFLMFLVYFLIREVPDTDIFISPPWLRWPLRFIQLSGMLFGMSSLLVLDASEFFGIKQMKRCISVKNPDLSDLSIEGLTELRLVANGVYSIVRHPIYLAGITMISFQPDITFRWLSVAIIADVYFIVAAVKEERILIKSIGEEYISYSQRVPMFNIFKGIYIKFL